MDQQEWTNKNGQRNMDKVKYTKNYEHLTIDNY